MKSFEGSPRTSRRSLTKMRIFGVVFGLKFFKNFSTDKNPTLAIQRKQETKNQRLDAFAI